MITIFVAVIAAVAAVAAAAISGKAERNSRPVSNGFAAGVVSQLGEIRREQGEMHQKLDDHIADHQKVGALEGPLPL